MEQLSGIDSLLLYMEKKNTPMHIGGMLVFKPKSVMTSGEKRRKILASLASRMGKAKVFKRKLYQPPFALDNAYWVNDENFDLCNHLNYLSLPAQATRQMLDESIARVYGRPLDMSKPLWEACIIDGLEALPEYPEGSYGLLFKAHHAAIDGMSGAEIVAALCTPGESTPAAPPELLKPSMALQVRRATSNNLRRPAKISKALRAIYSAQRLQNQAKAEAEQKAVWSTCLYNQSVSKSRNIGSLRIANSSLQLLRKAVPNTTINHVVLAIVSGGMRKYLAEMEQVENMPMNTMVPISIRGAGDEAGGNLISMMIASLGTEIDDPLERLTHIRNEATQARNQARKRGKSTLSTLIDGMHPLAMKTASSLLQTITQRINQVPTPVHTIVSNIPGPDMPLYMDGEELVDLIGMGLIAEPCGVFHAVVSYRGNTTISALSCPEVISSPSLYTHCLQASLDELVVSIKESNSAADIAPKALKEAAMLKTG